MSTSMRGVTLVPGTIVQLQLDGTLVIVEEATPIYAGVVALPEQLPSRTEEKFFVPGRVGIKKISPFAAAAATFALDQLSERNQLFVANYVALRTANGPNHVDRTPEEIAAMTVVKVDPKAAKQAARDLKKANKAAEKAAKSGKQPVCVKCGQQRGHLDHPGNHEFEPPVVAAVDPAAPAVKAPKAARVPRSTVTVSGAYEWIGDDAGIEMIAAVNPKYKANNSGAAIIAAIKDGCDTPEAVQADLAANDRWKDISLDRLQVAFKQLSMAKLIQVKP